MKNSKADNTPKILEREYKSLFTISLPQLVPSVHAAEGFYVALVKSSESQFTASLKLSDIDHVCRYACVVIEIEKEFNFSPGPYWLDIFSLSILAPEMVDKVAYCYFHLPLIWANTFYTIRIKQEIAWLDIIVLQVANRAFALKIALTWATKQKIKCKEQFELI